MMKLFKFLFFLRIFFVMFRFMPLFAALVD